MQIGKFAMKAFIRILSIACVTLLVGGAVAPPPPPPPPPPAPSVSQGSHVEIVDPDELRYAPVRGQQSRPTALVLNDCRAKISKPVSMSVVWGTYYERTGWFCRYKVRSAH